MKKFTEYKNLDLIGSAENVLKFWEENDTFEKKCRKSPGES